MQSLPFTARGSQGREHRIWVCSRLVSCWLRVLIGQRVSIISVIEWHKNCWNHVAEIVRAQKDNRGMLFNKRTILLIVAKNALGLFTGSGNVNPFLVDLFVFRRSSRVEINNKSKSTKVTKLSSSGKCKILSEETNVLEFWPQFDMRSSSGCKIEWIASFVGSWGETWI